MSIFKKKFYITNRTLILDVGGSEFNWGLIPNLPKPIIVNLYYPSKEVTTLWIVADGTALPFRDKCFDIVYSNSVIEHLGTYERQKLFAEECRRVGVSYYVQTPNRKFPIEPHLLTPLIHYLPYKIQRKFIRYTVWALIAKPSVQELENFFSEVRLLDERELQILFPDAEIWHETWFGLVKSIIAVRRDYCKNLSK